MMHFTTTMGKENGENFREVALEIKASYMEYDEYDKTDVMALRCKNMRVKAMLVGQLDENESKMIDLFLQQVLTTDAKKWMSGVKREHPDAKFEFI